jgi:hypothetical protein
MGCLLWNWKTGNDKRRSYGCHLVAANTAITYSRITVGKSHKKRLVEPPHRYIEYYGCFSVAIFERHR